LAILLHENSPQQGGVIGSNGSRSANPSPRRSIVALGFEQVADTLKSNIRQLTDKANGRARIFTM
jgi:hypothetical protein